MTPVLAEASDEHLHVTFHSASPLTLHDSTCWRTDGNSPIRVRRSGTTAFFSSYLPLGHTLRRHGTTALRFDEPAIPVRLCGDPDPSIGKWIEAIWETPDGLLHGWYHAEEPAPCAAKLYLPYIGHAVSQDDGRTWQCCEEVLRSPATSADCSWQNGFFAGGFGDLCVVPDRASRSLFMFFSSYHRNPAGQGVAVLRMAADDPSARADWWCRDGWREVPYLWPRPLWPARRGWRHSDPDCFWGPAVHYNRALDAWIMLLNRTAGGEGDLVQEGIYASINPALDDPLGWSAPLQIVRGGAWYPQAVGLEDGCGDSEAGAVARFFMAGFSAWEITFSRPMGGRAANRPLTPTKQAFAELFGHDRRCPW